MDCSTTDEGVSTIYGRIVLCWVRLASYDQRSVAYGYVANGAGIEDSSAKAIGRAVESESCVIEGIAVLAIEAARLRVWPRKQSAMDDTEGLRNRHTINL